MSNLTSGISRRSFLAATGSAATSAMLAPRKLFSLPDVVSASGLVQEAREGAASAAVTVQQLRGNVSVLMGAGGNIAVLPGRDGKLLIDAGFDGPVGTRSDLSIYRDLLVSTRDKVAALKKQGKSLDEIIAAKPTAAYDAKWGYGFMSPRMFTGLVFEGV